MRRLFCWGLVGRNDLTHGSIADSGRRGPYRWAKNVLNGLQAKGWKMSALIRFASAF
jgi:hypothetical protein